MNKQIILVEFNNCAPFLYLFKSYSAITIDMVLDYFVNKEDFNEDKDSITFLDKPTIIKLWQ